MKPAFPLAGVVSLGIGVAEKSGCSGERMRRKIDVTPTLNQLTPRRDTGNNGRDNVLVLRDMMVTAGYDILSWLYDSKHLSSIEVDLDRFLLYFYSEFYRIN